MATVNVNVNGTGEVDDPEKLVDELAKAAKKAAPKMQVSVNVTLSQQVQPEAEEQQS